MKIGYTYYHGSKEKLNRFFRFDEVSKTITPLAFDGKLTAFFALRHNKSGSRANFEPVPDNTEVWDLLGNTLLVIRGKLVKKYEQGELVTIERLTEIFEICQETDLLELLTRARQVQASESMKAKVANEVKELPRQHPLHAKNLELEKEVGRLNKLVAQLQADNKVLEEAEREAAKLHHFIQAEYEKRVQEA